MPLLPVNHAYFQVANCLFFISFLLTDILMLRIVIALANFFFLLWAWVILDIALDTVIWNAVFFVINASQAILIIYNKRRIHFEPDLEAAYTNVFSKNFNFSRTDFAKIVKCGEIVDLELGDQIMKEGHKRLYLGLVLSGRLKVSRDEVVIAHNEACEFFGVVEYVQKQKLAKVSVDAAGPARAILWRWEVLEDLKKKMPQLESGLSNLLMADLCMKLARSDDSLPYLAEKFLRRRLEPTGPDHPPNDRMNSWQSLDGLPALGYTPSPSDASGTGDAGRGTPKEASAVELRALPKLKTDSV